jgi:S1-C subfamily serine protease
VFPGGDYGVIRNDSAFGLGDVDRYDGTEQPITSAGTAFVGERVCASGEATGLTCGRVTAVDQTVDYGDGNVVHGLIETTVRTDHGDSGGPLFDGSTGLGTVSGGDGTTDYFQPLPPVLAAYGLALAPPD